MRHTLYDCYVSTALQISAVQAEIKRAKQGDKSELAAQLSTQHATLERNVNAVRKVLLASGALSRETLFLRLRKAQRKLEQAENWA